MSARPWTDRYVGLPWKDKGRGPDGYDCWGLVRLVLAQERGVELPAYLEGYASATDVADAARAVAAARPDWDEVPAAQARDFDVVLLRNGRDPTHVGVYAGRGRMLHVSRAAAASVVVHVDSSRFAPRVLGFFRWARGS